MRLEPGQLVCSLLIILSLSTYAAETPADLLQKLASQSSEASKQRLMQIERYREQIASLESTHDVYHSGLIEPISALVELTIAEGDFDQVDQLLKRKLQLVRGSVGFEDSSVKLVLEEIVSNEIRLQDWQQVSDELEHIEHLILQSGDTLQQLKSMERKADWYLARVTLDKPELRSTNFLAARRLRKDILDLAEDYYGENNEALIPWLYDLAISEYRLVSFLRAEGGLSFSTIEELTLMQEDEKLRYSSAASSAVNAAFGNSRFIIVTEDAEKVGDAYLRDALYKLERIKTLYEKSGNLEAQAMAMIYHADFQLLLGYGTAFREYRNAQEKLVEAGVPEQQVERFFEQPLMLPVDNFFPDLQAAITHQQQAKSTAMLESSTFDGEYLSLGELSSWNYDLAQLQMPAWPEGIGRLNEVGLNEASAWPALKHEKIDLSFAITSRGNTTSVKVLETSSSVKQVRRSARDGIRKLQFRPAIIDGKSQRTNDVLLHLHIVPRA